MVLTRSVMERLMACEEHPEMIHPIVQRWYHIPGHGNIGFSEDNFIHKLMLENGYNNIAPLYRQEEDHPSYHRAEGQCFRHTGIHAGRGIQESQHERFP